MSLGIHDIEQLLRRFGPASNDIVLIGGQAVNFWSERYLKRGETTLGAHAPYTSKDVDFCGGTTEGKRCADAVGGKLLVPDMDAVTPNSCVVQYRDAANAERTIDFLNAPFGLKREDVFRLRLPFPVPGSTGRLWVMHPVHCLESRTSNVAGLPGHDTEHALGQLKASITCARLFLNELIDANQVRAALNLNERIFRFSERNRNAIKSSQCTASTRSWQ